MSQGERKFGSHCPSCSLRRDQGNGWRSKSVWGEGAKKEPEKRNNHKDGLFLSLTERLSHTTGLTTRTRNSKISLASVSCSVFWVKTDGMACLGDDRIGLTGNRKSQFRAKLPFSLNERKIPRTVSGWEASKNKTTRSLRWCKTEHRKTLHVDYS